MLVPLDTIVGEAYQGRHLGRPTRSIQDLISCHQDMVAIFRGHNNPGPKSVGVVAGILALSILPVGWIHAARKTFRPFF
jgi:hypothetical protein